jgi:molybdopterin-containing oxidoreductase family iron-sulfur binding subunit
MEACPYGARTFHKHEATYYFNEKTPFEEMKQDFPDGIVMKCNFCADRVDQGLDPACVQTCPTECRVFGDLDDPQSKVAQIIAEKKARPLLAEKGLEPSVFYVGS